MATITIKDLDALADLALMNADMCEGEPELAVDGYQFRQVSDALRKLLRVDNRDHLKHVLDQLAELRASEAAADAALNSGRLPVEENRPRCVSCGEPIDVEFSDRCPDCAKLQASKSPVTGDGDYQAPSLAECYPSDLPPDDPPERGGYREMHEDDPIDRWPFCCGGCGAKRIGDCTCG